MDYKAIQKFLIGRSLPYFTFCAKLEKFVKAHIKHLLDNNSSEDITVVFQEPDHDVVGIKQITPKRSTSEGGVTHISLPFFIVTLARNKKTPEIFKFTTLQHRTIRLLLDSVHRLVCGSLTVSVLRWMGQGRPTQLGP
jgi:hypothetical protein